MSANMLSDANTINDFNPFVMGPDFSLPGASRKPHAFEMHTRPREPPAPEADPTSPICDYGITAGRRTIDMCRPQEPNCPLSRPLVPGRNIDYGFTRTVKRAAGAVTKEVSRAVANGGTMEMGLVVITILILLLAVR